MSRFIEKLKNSTKVTPAPMGFRSSITRAKPRMSLVASVPPEMEMPADSIAGADAVMVTPGKTGSSSEVLKTLNGLPGSVSLGIRLEGSQPADLIEGNKADFFIFPLETPLFEIPEETGTILELDFSSSDGLLRAVEEMPVNAVLINEKVEKLTWRHLCQIQQIDNMVSKPLLVSVISPIDVNGLQMLWGAGVDGVIVDTTAEDINIKELRQLIDKANFPIPRKAKKTDVTLPVFPAASPVQQEEEEEDE